MSESFFESDVVAHAIMDIMELQNEVLVFSEFVEFATLDQQRQNLEQLKRLKDKQQNMVFRCILSDDKDAKGLLKEVMDHFRDCGHEVDYDDPMKVFEGVAATLKEMEDDLDYAEKHGYFPGEEPGGESPPFFM